MITTSQAPVVPAGTTHVWTCAVDKPWIQWVFRRAYYKRAHGMWFSYSLNNEWVPSSNDDEWFNTEKENGYFVTITQFKSPEFVFKKEEL